MPQRGTGGTPSAPGASMSGMRRGTVVAVVPVAKYRAGIEYDFADVCGIGHLIATKRIKKKDLDDRDPADPSRLFYGVPRTTMVEWLKDDAEVMRKRGKRGFQERRPKS